MTTVFDQSGALAGTDDGNVNSNQNIRVVTAVALETAFSGNQGQLVFLWGTAAPSVAGVCTSVWFGQVGASPPDFTGNQVQVKVAGASSFASSAHGVVTSDVFTLPANWDNTKRYVCAFHILSGANGNISVAAITGCNVYNGSGADDASSTHSTTTTLNTANSFAFLEKIIVTAAAGGTPVRRNSSLSGLGASGPFFHDPMARSSLGWRPSLILPRKRILRPAIERIAA